MGEPADETIKTTPARRDAANEPISFAEFLQSIPPSTEMTIVDLFDAPSNNWKALYTPQLLLHCDSELCAGMRAHRRVEDAPTFQASAPSIKNIFLEYICSNCRTRKK